VKTLGHRAYPDGAHFLASLGGYWKHERTGEWFAHTPSGQLANLSRHSVTEHDDGTITASPSILISGGGEAPWHGYLERGVWREV